MFASIVRLAIWLLLVVSVIAIGWDEPLRYKFMSTQQIAEEELAYRPKPKKKPGYQDFKPSSTLLDATPAQGRTTRQAPGRGLSR